MKLTLIGFGFVGKAVQNLLQEHYAVKAVDPATPDPRFLIFVLLVLIWP